MNNNFSFSYIDPSQFDNLDTHHPLLHLDKNSRHDARPFINKIRTCPDFHDDLPLFFYVYDKDTIAASMKALPDYLYINGIQNKWAWNCDIFTEPQYRGQGAASTVYEKTVPVLLQRDFIIGGAYMGPITKHFGGKTGHMFTDNATRLLFFKNCEAFLNAHLKFPLLNKLTSAFYATITRNIKRIPLYLNNSSLSNLTIEKIDSFANRSYRDFFDDIKRTEIYTFNHSEAKTRWKVEHSRNNEVYLLSDKASNKRISYVILRNRFMNEKFADRYSGFNLMTLVDFGFNNNEDIDTSLSFIENVFWKSNADVLEFITSNPSLIRKANLRGFIKAGKGIEFFYQTPPNMALDQSAQKISNWHFTHFASDSYSF